MNLGWPLGSTGITVFNHLVLEGRTIMIWFRRFTLFTGLIFAVFLLSSCSGEENTPSKSDSSAGAASNRQAAVSSIFRSVSSTEAQAMLKKNPELILIDVRTPQERRQVRIAGSRHVAVGDVVRGKLDIPREKPVMLVCAVGGRSYVAAKALTSMGHTEVYNLEGGIEAWHRAGMGVELGPESPTTE